MTGRPCCPVCLHVVDRTQHSHGAVALYPCQHWLDPEEAQPIAARIKELAEGSTLR